MKLETLVAILAIGIPAINIVIPMVNNIVNLLYENHKSNKEYIRNNKLNALTEFLNNITNYCKEPNDINKNVCYASFTKLYCYYNIDEDYSYDDFFTNKLKVDFDELNKFIKSLK